MEFVNGRNNFAMTVFVPYDCTNNCPFCTTKCLYKNIMSPEDAEKIISKHLESAEKSSVIQDIVFTGGEPMMDLDMLQRFIKLVPSKNVYINTNLLKENFFSFVKLVNKMPQIKGINVSRHKESPLNEPKNQVEDWCLEAFEKPIRINVVIPADKTLNEVSNFIETVLDRWNGMNATVNFRADYTKMTSEELHSFTSDIPAMLIRHYEFVAHSCCDVCDSLKFYDPAHSQYFTYHRGLEESSINLRTKTIVNDAILMPYVKTTAKGQEPDYGLFYDWNQKTAPEFEELIYDGNGKRRRSSKSAATKTTTKSTTATKSTPATSKTPAYEPPSRGCGFFSTCGHF